METGTEEMETDTKELPESNWCGWKDPPIVLGKIGNYQDWESDPWIDLGGEG